MHLPWCYNCETNRYGPDQTHEILRNGLNKNVLPQGATFVTVLEEEEC
jgi:hypothetical protein